MDEVEAVERMALVLDAAVHVGAAGLAGVALDHRRGIDDLELVAVLEHGDVLARHHGHDREHRALRFPALGAAAGVVVRHVALDADFDLVIPAFADQRATCKAAAALLDALIDRGMECNSHRTILLVWVMLLI